MMNTEYSCWGGSTVFAGFPLSHALPGLLEMYFHEKEYKQVRVYNAGVVSYVSGQELALLIHTLSEYNPDMIVLYDGANDIHQPYTRDPRPGYPFNFIVYEEGFNRIQGEIPMARFIPDIFYKSAFLRYLFRHVLLYYIIPIDKVREDCGFKSKKWEKKIVSKYISNLDKMCHVAKGYDYKIVAFLQPMVFFKTPILKEEEKYIGEQEFHNYVLRQYDRTRSGYAMLRDKYSGGKRCFFIDLSMALSNYPKVAFTDFVHIDDEAKKIVAS